MKPYGQHRKDHGCCPGHDKFTSDKNPTRASARKFKKSNKVMRRKARRTIKIDTGIDNDVVFEVSDGK